tara:strand:- start:6743 stop:7144 length:402 start_codon:yes stop_codon:yes gene_type:complete
MDSQKKIILKTFNIQLKKFLTFTDETIPGNEDIETLSTLASLLIKCNPKKIIYLWAYYIASPYLPIIENGDFTYFEKKDYSEDVKDLKDNASYVLECYNKIKNKISNLDETYKKEAMNYIQILTKLSLKFHKK